MLSFIEILNKKSCDGCTKCCEGYLSATIHGREMFPGKPCIFVEQGVGCKEYETRPYDPCVLFQCEWRRNPHFDEWLAPTKTDVIFVRQPYNGFEYLQIAEAGRPASEEIIAWAKDYSEKHNMNIKWSVDGVAFFAGSQEFLESVKNERP